MAIDFNAAAVATPDIAARLANGALVKYVVASGLFDDASTAITVGFVSIALE